MFLTSTIISHSTSSVLKHLSKILENSSSSPSALLYILSPGSSLPDSQLSDLVTTLTAVPNSVGCLSSALPLRSRETATSVSVALFSLRNTTSFRSTIPGRKATSVGRWHSVRNQQDARNRLDARKSPQTNLEEIRGIDRYDLPSALSELSPENAKSVIYLSDNSPEGLSQSLASSLTHSTQLGFLASPTPFLTGRPFTLFRDREIHSSGAVGICLPSPVSQYDVEYPHLTAITEPLTVTSAGGNLVHSLDDENPARLIISAMDKHNLSSLGNKTLYKEDQFYLGVLDGDKLHRLYQIMSGGPSRGTVSLEGEDAPQHGVRVRIYHLSGKTPVTDQLVKRSAQEHTFNFLNLHPEYPDSTTFKLDDGLIQSDEDGTIVLPNVFLAASQHGCMVRRREVSGEAESAWRFSVAGGAVRLGWPA